MAFLFPCDFSKLCEKRPQKRSDPKKKKASHFTATPPFHPSLQPCSTLKSGFEGHRRTVRLLDRPIKPSTTKINLKIPDTDIQPNTAHTQSLDFKFRVAWQPPHTQITQSRRTHLTPPFPSRFPLSRLFPYLWPAFVPFPRMWGTGKASPTSGDSNWDLNFPRSGQAPAPHPPTKESANPAVRLN